MELFARGDQCRKILFLVEGGVRVYRLPKEFEHNGIVQLHRRRIEIR